MPTEDSDPRTMGLVGATAVGVGAIVGGGILALTGAAFASTGPSAVLAFALNGVIALLTAMSFAEMASAFPQSGGTYLFSKKVLSVEAAFTIGWVVWLASILAAMLYALGFAYFALVVVAEIYSATGGTLPNWATSRVATASIAIAAVTYYAVNLALVKSGESTWINIGKLAVFGVLIASGLWALTGRSAEQISQNMTPFFAAGGMGLIQAMGFTFVAFQGFELIAAVGGEVRRPKQNIPRAMFLSLFIALAIYVPLSLVISTVGMLPGDSVTEISRANPEKVIAIAAENYLGAFGYWLVIVAAILSMLSALQANLFAASRMAVAMSVDHTLPNVLSKMHPRRGTPVVAILTTLAIVVVIILVMPDVGAAGAAASLVVLVTFALANLVSILLRYRTSELARIKNTKADFFRTPFFPAVPIVAAIACLSLAVFQGIAVPAAGLIASVWLAIGGILFLTLFVHRARVVDALSESLDPDVAQLRGRAPLVLVPLANPGNTDAMVAIANTVVPRGLGRVILLSVIVAKKGWQTNDDPKRFAQSQLLWQKAIDASLTAEIFPEVLTTISSDPWKEIIRVAKLHRCENVVLGMTSLNGNSDSTEESAAVEPSRLDELLGALDCNVIVFRAKTGLELATVERILVPVGGRGGHDELRARTLGSLARIGLREIVYLRVLPVNTSAKEQSRVARSLSQLARYETFGRGTAKIILSDSVEAVVIEQAAEADLLLLGSQRLSRNRKLLGDFTLRIARQTSCAMMVISRKG